MHFYIGPFVLLVIIGSCKIQCAKLPSTFGRCHISDPDPQWRECTRKNIESSIHQMKNKVYKEIGLPPMEPLPIPALIIGEGKGPVNVQQNFKNVKLHGLTDSTVLSSFFDIKNYDLYAESITPELRLEAEYEMAGRVLLLPIVGKGNCNVTLINTKLNHTLLGEKIEKNGNDYLHITDYTVTLRPEKVIFKFDNLFDGDERLGKEINNVLNDNNKEVFGDVREGYEKSFGLIFKDLANRVFSRVPLKDIFLE